MEAYIFSSHYLPLCLSLEHIFLASEELVKAVDGASDLGNKFVAGVEHIGQLNLKIVAW
jgi:hypothetical protein